MSLAFYQSRVRRPFHRLPTLIIPLMFVMLTVAYDIALLLATDYWFLPNLTPVKDIFFIPLALGLSALGMDSSEGLMPVLLTRPLPRSVYVIGHWAALGTVACFWSLLHLLLEWGLIQATHYQPPPTVELLYNGLGRISLCFGMAATLVCLSARLPAYGNVLAWCGLFFLFTRVLPGFGNDDTLRILFPIRQFLMGVLAPELDIRRTFAATPISWSRLTAYLSNVTLLLLLAMHIFNRREVSYASR